MATRPPGELKLDWSDMAIGLLPLSLVIAGSAYIAGLGGTVGAFEMTMVADSHLEAAGRLRMLATSFLTTVAGLCAIAYFFWNLPLFEPGTQGRLVGAYVALAIVGAFIVSGKHGGNSQVMMTQPVLCAPLRLIDAGGPGAHATMRVWRGERPGLVPDPAAAEKCRTTPTFLKLERINDWHRYFLILILPAAVLGAISCLAKPVKGARSVRDSVERLKIWVYLTAVMFVSGMLLMSALLRWPGFAYQGEAQKAYYAHVSAYVLSLGILYTIFIAAYYLPVFASIRGRHKQRRPAAGADSELLDPLDFGKIMLGVFAPAIAGLLGDVIQF